MPSVHEPFGIVALEAMASESILVTTAKCGIKEIVEGTDYVHINNVNDLNHAYNYIKLLPEPEKNKIKQQNKNYVSKFDWKIQSNKLYEIYKEVLTMEYNPNMVKMD
jgi:glycosyltransferase involved in cell wall biosynthesis